MLALTISALSARCWSVVTLDQCSGCVIIMHHAMKCLPSFVHILGSADGNRMGVCPW